MDREIEEFIEECYLTCDLIIGDCIKLSRELEDNFINCTVTSPPYNKHSVGSTKESLVKEYIPGKQSNGVFRKIEYDSFNDSLPEDVYQEQQVELLDTLYDKTVPGGSLFYNHKVRYLKGDCIHPIEWLRKSKWHIREELIWTKSTGTEISGYRFTQCEERIYWLCKGDKHPKMSRKCADFTSVWKFPPDVKNSHPAPYPLVLPLRCIEAVMSEPGVVLDPYSGSGTTGVAATLLGHDYIGFDLSECYSGTAKERIENPTKRDIENFRKYSDSNPQISSFLDDFFY
jgi:DNA modification methylase